MIYVLATRPSVSSLDLVAAINAAATPLAAYNLHRAARRLRVGQRQRWRRALHAGNIIVCWGEHCPRETVLRGDMPMILNANKPDDKLDEINRLAAAGVSVPTISAEPREGFLARTRNHQQAQDLRAGRLHGDFYVEKLDILREFRLHIFKGVCIRAGMKVPREGVEQHPWIRSFESGWNIDYGAECQRFVRQRHRDAAKAAVVALGLDFGAVDVGVTAMKSTVVFEVNTAPSLDNPHTAAAYARKIVELGGLA